MIMNLCLDLSCLRDGEFCMSGNMMCAPQVCPSTPPSVTAGICQSSGNEGGLEKEGGGCKETSCGSSACCQPRPPWSQLPGGSDHEMVLAAGLWKCSLFPLLDQPQECSALECSPTPLITFHFASHSPMSCTSPGIELSLFEISGVPSLFCVDPDRYRESPLGLT